MIVTVSKALQKPQYGIEHLNLFPRYNSAEEYRQQTGRTPPAYVPTKPLKLWEDPAALKSKARFIPYQAISYDERNLPEIGPDGRPVIISFSVQKTDAAVVNVPELLASMTADQIGTQIPMPIRPLEPEEELAFGFGSVPVVRNTKLWADEMAAQPGFGPDDRALLRAIAAKLEV